ncbi:germin family protein [Abortiporus biennis]
MNTPHTHPRATEVLYSINGTVEFGEIGEGGDRFVFGEINAGQAGVFLKGAVHFQINNGCDPIQLVAILSSNDPGVQSTSQRFFGLPPSIVSASLGDLGVQEIANLESMIPDNVALGSDQCLQRCGLNRQGQPTTQRQPRVAGNAFPANITSASPSAASASASSHSRRQIYEDEEEEVVSSGESTAHFFTRITTPLTADTNTLNLALVALVGFMAMGYVVVAISFVRNRRERSSRYFQDTLTISSVERYSDKSPRVMNSMTAM